MAPSPSTVSLPSPTERPMLRDRFMQVAYWVLAAFLVVQLCLMAWLDVRK